MNTIITSDYKDEILQFFQGKNYYADNHNKGYLRVLNFDGFDTLTVDSITGQYDIAVRIPSKEGGSVFWAGYWCDPAGSLHGVNTGGPP